MAYVKCLMNVVSSTLPDGKTVTPTDDVSILLACAGRTETYTTISALLADATALAGVISSNNAIDYLVRSTTFASDVSADQGAMADIGADNYASNTLLANSTWLTAICGSAYFESVLNVKVPVMTSNNTPSGECIFSSEVSQYEAYHAFTDQGYPTWLSGSTQPTSANPVYVGYKFTNSILVKCFDVVFRSDKVSTVNYKIQNYVNNEWVDISANLNNLSLAKSILNNTNISDKYRLLITSQTPGNNYGQVTTLQFYGRSTV